MSTASFLLTALLLLVRSNVSSGCSCMPTSLNATLQSTNNQSLIFRGTVIRDITPPPPVQDPNSPITPIQTGRRQYVVQVGRIFKGCSVKANERVLMTSNLQSSMCGMPLTVNTNYVFESPLGSRPIDAVTMANLGNRTQMRQTLSINLCGFNREWDTVSETDKTALRSSTRQCPSNR